MVPFLWAAYVHDLPVVTEVPAHEGLSHTSQISLKVIVLDAITIIKRKGLELHTGSDGGVADYLSAVAQLVDQIEIVANEGILVYMHDITGSALSQAALLIFRVSAQWLQGSVSDVLDVHSAPTITSSQLYQEGSWGVFEGVIGR